MPHIVLTPEQRQLVVQSSEPIEVKDDGGAVLAHLVPLSVEDLEAIERHQRTKGQPKSPGIPSATVQAHLRRLGEIRAAEGMDEAKMLDLLRRMHAGEEV